jgi:SAM-dependent methyltransferase
MRNSAAPIPNPGHAGLAAVSPWIARFAPLVTAGDTVLDLACGGGRHGRYFLDRGHSVCFVDKNLDGVADIAGATATEMIVVDLENGAPWPLDRRQFSVVVVVNYLYRPILPAIIAAVAPGGILLYETFAQGNERYGRPRNPDFLLAPGELLDAAAELLTVIAYQHGTLGDDTARAVKQCIAAVNGPVDTSVILAV